MAKVLECGLEVSEFELQLCYYVHFQISTLRKHEKHNLPSNGLNSITDFFNKNGFQIK